MQDEGMQRQKAKGDMPKKVEVDEVGGWKASSPRMPDCRTRTRQPASRAAVASFASFPTFRAGLAAFGGVRALSWPMRRMCNIWR